MAGKERGPVRDEPGVTPANVIQLARFLEETQTVLTDRFQHGVDRRPTYSLRTQQRRFDQTPEKLCDPPYRDHRVGGHRLGGIELEAAPKDGHPAQQRLFLRGQQPVAPIHGCFEGSLSGLGGPASGRQQAELIVHPTGHLRRGHRLQASSGQFEGKRNTRHPPADHPNRTTVGLRKRETRAFEFSPFDQELHGRRTRDIGEAVTGAGICQRLEQEARLSVDAEFPTAGRQYPQVWTRSQQPVHETATPSIRCSQLSRSNRLRRSRRWPARASTSSAPQVIVLTPSAPATSASIRRDCRAEPGRTIQIPSGCSGPALAGHFHGE